MEIVVDKYRVKVSKSELINGNWYECGGNLAFYEKDTYVIFEGSSIKILRYCELNDTAIYTLVPEPRQINIKV